MKRHKAIGEARPFAIPQNARNYLICPRITRIYANQPNLENADEPQVNTDRQT
jgi:hypothetical protein